MTAPVMLTELGGGRGDVTPVTAPAQARVAPHHGSTALHALSALSEPQWEPLTGSITGEAGEAGEAGGPTGGRRAAVSQVSLRTEIGRELHRAQLAGRPGLLAVVSVAELAPLVRRLGPRAQEVLALAFDRWLPVDGSVLEQHSLRAGGGVVLLLPETDRVAGGQRLRSLTRQIARAGLVIDGEHVRVTPLIGWSMFDSAAGEEELVDRVESALDHAGRHLDLIPVEWTPELTETLPAPAPSSRAVRAVARLTERVRVPLQISFTMAWLVLMPFLVYVLVYRLGFDLTHVTYPLVAAALAVTALALYAESFKAVGAVQLPPESAIAPPASAVVAAFLPNEAATILATLRNLLDHDYPGPLQVVLAYNTPQHLPVEDELAALAAEDSRLLLLRVDGSTSKAQNVNAALAYVSGEIVGVFDADHHPVPGSFARAARWLTSGHDVVQGHCVVRNGDASWVARMVAVEFETIYAVSHPGRARLHGFGIFGGSNGYWRTSALQDIRMHGSMLTEDIDSSMRSLLDGLSIVSDPGLISTELAPTKVKALWSQRMRWAQGWTQTAQRHLRPALRSRRLTSRQKVGAALLLGWTQIVPWVTIQVIPILGFAVWRHGWGGVDLLVPLFVLLSLFAFSVGPAQVLIAYFLADPSVRRHRGWFLVYAAHSLLWYGEFKNLISRVAQLKELVGEREWRVTPRTLDAPTTVVARGASPSIAAATGVRAGTPQWAND